MNKLTPPQIARLAVYVHRAVTENPPNEDVVTDGAKRAIKEDGCSSLWEWNLKKWIDAEKGDNRIADPLPKYDILGVEDSQILEFLIDYYGYDDPM